MQAGEGDPRAAGTFDPASRAIRVPGGAFAALLGSSAADADVKLQGRVSLRERLVQP